MQMIYHFELKKQQETIQQIKTFLESFEEGVLVISIKSEFDPYSSIPKSTIIKWITQKIEEAYKQTSYVSHDQYPQSKCRLHSKFTVIIKISSKGMQSLIQKYLVEKVYRYIEIDKYKNCNELIPLKQFKIAKFFPKNGKEIELFASQKVVSFKNEQIKLMLLDATAPLRKAMLLYKFKFNFKENVIINCNLIVIFYLSSVHIQKNTKDEFLEFKFYDCEPQVFFNQHSQNQYNHPFLNSYININNLFWRGSIIDFLKTGISIKISKQTSNLKSFEQFCHIIKQNCKITKSNSNGNNSNKNKSIEYFKGFNHFSGRDCNTIQKWQSLSEQIWDKINQGESHTKKLIKSAICKNYIYIPKFTIPWIYKKKKNDKQKINNLIHVQLLTTPVNLQIRYDIDYLNHEIVIGQNSYQILGAPTLSQKKSQYFLIKKDFNSLNIKKNIYCGGYYQSVLKTCGSFFSFVAFQIIQRECHKKALLSDYKVDGLQIIGIVDKKMLQKITPKKIKYVGIRYDNQIGYCFVQELQTKLILFSDEENKKMEAQTVEILDVICEENDTQVLNSETIKIFEQLAINLQDLKHINQRKYQKVSKILQIEGRISEQIKAKNIPMLKLIYFDEFFIDHFTKLSINHQLHSYICQNIQYQLSHYIIGLRLRPIYSGYRMQLNQCICSLQQIFVYIIHQNKIYKLRNIKQQYEKAINTNINLEGHYVIFDDRLKQNLKEIILITQKQLINLLNKRNFSLTRMDGITKLININTDYYSHRYYLRQYLNYFNKHRQIVFDLEFKPIRNITTEPQMGINQYLTQMKPQFRYYESGQQYYKFQKQYFLKSNEIIKRILNQFGISNYLVILFEPKYIDYYFYLKKQYIAANEYFTKDENKYQIVKYYIQFQCKLPKPDIPYAYLHYFFTLKIISD